MQAEAGWIEVENVQPKYARRTLRVLTLTPFYPSAEDCTRGGFVAEPLIWTERMGVANEVIAVSPFHRKGLQPADSEIPSQWLSYGCVPGNIGLPSAGHLLAVPLRSEVLRSHPSHHFDIIHAHAALPCGQAAASLSGRLGIPFVVTVHGLDAFAARQAGPVFGKWCRKASLDVYRKAASVICISEAVRERVREYGVGNTAVIYNGVNAEMFSPIPETDSIPTILSVGNLIPSKGHALLLRAFAEVVTEVPKCRLEIIGDGPERDRLVNMAQMLGVGEKASFLGRQSRESVAKAMQRCAVFALPSFYEGLGCVYLEAMACGKPAIGCRGQGIAEVIENQKNGLLVDPQNQSELANALRWLLTNEDSRRRMGTAARCTILRRFTLEHQAKDLVGIYGECAR